MVVFCLFFIADLKNFWSVEESILCSQQHGPVQKRESDHTCKCNFCKALGFLVAEISAVVGVYGMRQRSSVSLGRRPG